VKRLSGRGESEERGRAKKTKGEPVDRLLMQELKSHLLINGHQPTKCDITIPIVYWKWSLNFH